MHDDLFSPDNKIKSTIPEEMLSPVRKECEACHKDFDTTNRWSKRCWPCKRDNKPYTKKIFNPNELPFA